MKLTLYLLLICNTILQSGCNKEDDDTPEPVLVSEVVFKTYNYSTTLPLPGIKILIFGYKRTGGSILFPKYTNYPLDSLITDLTGTAKISREEYLNIYQLKNVNNYKEILVTAHRQNFLFDEPSQMLVLDTMRFGF